ncbi:uncharacterized protein JCM15063_001172 [Sporobolomyces koalae]|uniref:uncharacterized protein n=1 Tax=Sporobolomyces koalae TaxID=500713 RepID=UPI00317CA9BE
MSRRDEVVDTLDSLVSTFRTQLATAIQPADSRPVRSSQPARSHPSTPSLASRLSSFLDLPHPNTSAPPSPSLANSASVPFSSARHSSIPLPTSPRASRPPSPTAQDALPTYSRRPPPPSDPTADDSLPPKRLHLLASRTGKLHLELQARGREHVILIQDEPDGPTTLAGTLKVLLREPETVTHVKVRLKGIVRTLVMKAHASGRHPVSDEVTFHEASSTLYQYHAEGFLPSNESSDPTKLLGTFAFPFSLTVPAQITHYTTSNLPASAPMPLARPVRPPPSFMLDAQQTPNQRRNSIISTQSPAASGLGTGGFEVSCRYFIKVTLGRKGLLKMNERWIIPVVFVPRQITPIISPLRELALRTAGTRPPHSDVDPQGWTDSRKYVMKRTIKKPSISSWARIGSGGTTEIEIEGRTIRGHKVERGDAGSPGGTGSVPFEVVVKTNNAAITGKFAPNTINVFLVQRTAITAQRLTNAQDVVVATASSMHPFGPNPDGEPLNNGSGWKAQYGGNVRLPPHLGISFRAPNLSVTYVLCFSINVGGISNDLTPLTIPIELINCPPRRAVASAGQEPPPPPLTPQPPAPLELAPDVPTPTHANVAVSPPPPPPRHPSKAAGSSASPVTGSQGEPNGSSRRLERVQTEEETELQALYGLPPSYFDTVGMDQGTSARR